MTGPKCDQTNEMIGNCFEAKSPRIQKFLAASHRSARCRGPQEGAGQANGPVLLHFGWTISINGALCQLDLAYLNFLTGVN